MLIKQQKRIRRHKRVRAKIKGTDKVPRLCVFRSAKHIYAQLINDENSRTLVAASDLELKKSKIKSQKTKNKEQRSGKVALAYEVGKLIAKKAKDLKFDKVVFDRAGYKYHGRIKTLAEGAREGGLRF
jgi:large subunit ribosomal protein L18